MKCFENDDFCDQHGYKQYYKNYHHSFQDLKDNNMILKTYRTEVHRVKVFQMFWQLFRTLMWQNFVLLLVMKSQEFSKQFFGLVMSSKH